MAIRARYTGDGTEFHYGIPTRDLTDEEYEALPLEDKRTLQASPLYKVLPTPETRAKAKEAATAEPAAQEGG